jgi:hypothetical protein
VFKNADSRNDDSVYKTGIIEHVLEFGNTAVIADPITFKCIDNTLVKCEIPSFSSSNSDRLQIIYSNSEENNMFRICKERFIKIKPQVLDINLYHIRTSLNNEGILLIS